MLGSGHGERDMVLNEAGGTWTLRDRSLREWEDRGMPRCDTAAVLGTTGLPLVTRYPVVSLTSGMQEEDCVWRRSWVPLGMFVVGLQ